MTKHLQPLFKNNGEHSERFWTLENVIERLKIIHQEEIQIAGIKCKTTTELDDDQNKIMNLLGIKISSHKQEN